MSEKTHIAKAPEPDKTEAEPPIRALNEKVAQLLQLYENTLSLSGVPRREEPREGLSGDRRLGHVRWCIDEIQQNAARGRWSEEKIANKLGFIQGVLWAEMLFSRPAIEDHSDNALTQRITES